MKKNAGKAWTKVPEVIGGRQVLLSNNSTDTAHKVEQHVTVPTSMELVTVQVLNDHIDRPLLPGVGAESVSVGSALLYHGIVFCVLDPANSH